MRFEIGGDLAKEFKNRWNQRLRWVRVAGYIVGILFLIFGAACLFSPLRSAAALKAVIAVFILGLGVVRFFEYFMTPALTRFGGKLVSAIFNITIGVILIQMPTSDALTIFSFVIGFYLLISGVSKLAYASQLHVFGVKECGWVIVDGAFKLLTAFIFFAMPMLSVAMLNVILGLYLLIDGMSILLETADTKNLEFKHSKKSEIREAEVVKKK